MLDPKDHDRSVMVDTTMKPLGSQVDLPSHAILDRGRVIGLWEFDVDSGSIVWATFDGKRDRALMAVVEPRRGCATTSVTPGRSASTARRVARRGSKRFGGCVKTPRILRFAE